MDYLTGYTSNLESTCNRNKQLRLRSDNVGMFVRSNVQGSDFKALCCDQRLILRKRVWISTSNIGVRMQVRDDAAILISGDWRSNNDSRLDPRLVLWHFLKAKGTVKFVYKRKF